MCGISGIFDFRGRATSPELLERMTAAIRHRGPDGWGTFAEGPVGLGHRRLSIIDLEGGRQPLDNEDGRLQVVFNGEIYNFVELRDELVANGHVFKTQSDTEVILHAYEEWGTDCVLRFNGMFAFAIWDGHARVLFLARDHLGIKPLYHTTVDGRFLFASEVKALLQDPQCPREVDRQALAELFTFRYVPSPRTLFEGINKLPPGHRMTVTNGGVKIERYWCTRPCVTQGLREEEAIGQYQSLLDDAVRIQLRSDVPLGLFLSSGVDSAALLALMSERTSGPVRTFTIGFESGEATNEIDDARDLARMFGANHHSMVVTADDYAGYYERYMQDLEEPVGNETAVAFYFLSRITSEHVKVALTGQGADEPWAGYHRHLGAKLSAIYSSLPTPVTAMVAALAGTVPGRFERLHRSTRALGERDHLARLVKVYSFFSADMKRQLAPGDSWFCRSAAELGLPLAQLQADVADRDVLTQMLYVDTRSNLPDDLLMVGDKMAMANSLEARVPYLDVRLVEFIERLPSSMKLRRFTGKYLHKKALARWLPASVVWRKKKGFANPVEHWFRNRMRSFVDEHLLSSDSACAQFFDQSYIEQLLRRDRQGTAQLRRHIYLLLSFELWHRAYIRR